MTAGDEILVELTFRSASGQSVRSKPPETSSGELARYQASEGTRRRAIEVLENLGFRIIGRASPFGVSICGSRALVSQVFGIDAPRVPEILVPYIESACIPAPGEFYTG
jgi:hypothetical protein